MALFGKKKPPASANASEGKEEKKNSVQDSLALRSSLSGAVAHVLRNPRITEKATMHSDAGVYTFDIAEGATKRSVAQAVELIYKVTPRKIAIVQVPSKTRRSMRTGKTGVTRGGKKAYVYLKKGESITIA